MIGRLITPIALVALLLGLSPLASSGARTQSLRVKVVATGLTNPRGFAWGADGTLYLGLAGSGGTTPAQPPSPMMAGKSASVVKIVNGCAVPIAGNLPSARWDSPGERATADWVWGTNDVAVLDGQLYALVAAGGPLWGNPDYANGIYTVNADGTTTLVADLGKWFEANPTTFVPPDYNPDGSLFELVAAHGALYVSEAVGGRVLRVMPSGEITILADLSEGHLVPTGIAVDGEGNVYVGYETTPPYDEGMAKISKVALDGTVTDAWTGLTTVTGIAIGPDGTLYAAEMSAHTADTAPYLQAGTGKIVRQTGPSSSADVATGLDAPVAIRFAPDGGLYVTEPAFGSDDGTGALLRLDISSGMPIALPGQTSTAIITCVYTPSV